MVFVACTVHVYSEYAMLDIDISMYTVNVTTKTGAILLYFVYTVYELKQLAWDHM